MRQAQTAGANAPPSPSPSATARDDASASTSIAWWSPDAASSETELLGAAVLCEALARASSESPTAPNAGSIRRQVEATIRSSPLPHRLSLPTLAFTPRYVVVESASAVICAVRATSTNDVLEAVLGSTMPLSQPYVYRYGGARIHLPFWRRAQQLDLQGIYSMARACNKTLLICGHSIAGSVAQLALCELVYQQLPMSLVSNEYVV
ncbi:hypothetical protein ATCC90586_008029 [Pythium insidiosum]|nr:hypothetical protein ATCC90586_008029 [Pythium insidiosum]